MPIQFLISYWWREYSSVIFNPQVATKINSFMGYGPVVPDGYGASYNPKEDSIIFCISSFYSNENTDTNKFTESLRDGLNSMKDLLAYEK